MTPLPTLAKPVPLTVRRTSGLNAAHAHVLIYGKTKAGKTSTAVTLEADPKKNGIISTQPEEQLAHLRNMDIPYVLAHDYAALSNALSNWRDLFPEASTLIIDDYTEAVDFKRAYEESINGRVGDGVFATFRNTMRWADDTLRELLNAPVNLIVTAFERELKEEGNPLQWLGPDLPPSTANVVTAKFDFILHLSNFKLRTKPDNSKRIIAGNRWPLAKVASLKDEVEPNLAKLWKEYQQAFV